MDVGGPKPKNLKNRSDPWERNYFAGLKLANLLTVKPACRPPLKGSLWLSPEPF
jgi:hypothetical protein